MIERPHSTRVSMLRSIFTTLQSRLALERTGERIQSTFSEVEPSLNNAVAKPTTGLQQ
jgi:hypothetical protein